MILLAALAFLLPGALLLGARMWLQRRDNARDDSADWLGVGGASFPIHDAEQ